MDTKISALNWFEDWVYTHCDGEWEHTAGIRISTIDNPGWSVSIPIGDADYKKDEILIKIDSEDGKNWISCFIKDGVFRGYGDTRKLADILECFRDFQNNIVP